MTIVAISDTHGKHNSLSLPKGDMLIHAGDVSGRGLVQEITDFLHWFARQDYTYKIFIAGNHDFYFENAALEDVQSIIPKDVIYLNDTGVTVEGLHIWGSPITPWFYNWAFNRHRGVAIKKHWDLIPLQTDILITHGPVQGILDRTTRNDVVGCADLLAAVQNVKPKMHICGHIHESYGSIEKNGTQFVNASVLNERYQLVNSPVVL
jgi:Icc-related predicted phosphoesterase